MPWRADLGADADAATGARDHHVLLEPARRVVADHVGVDDHVRRRASPRQRGEGTLVGAVVHEVEHHATALAACRLQVLHADHAHPGDQRRGASAARRARSGPSRRPGPRRRRRRPVGCARAGSASARAPRRAPRVSPTRPRKRSGDDQREQRSGDVPADRLHGVGHGCHHAPTFLRPGRAASSSTRSVRSSWRPQSQRVVAASRPAAPRAAARSGSVSTAPSASASSCGSPGGTSRPSTGRGSRTGCHRWPSRRPGSRWPSPRPGSCRRTPTRSATAAP